MKLNCCPVLTFTVVTLFLGASTAAILSQMSWEDSPCGSCSKNRTSSTGTVSLPQKNFTSAQPPASVPQRQPDDDGKPAPFNGDSDATPAPEPDPKNPAKRVELGKNVYFESQGDKRRVVIQSFVCLRQGQLEQLLTTDKLGKKHESILAADMDASTIHTGLLLCQAKAGHPIRFQPKLEPPTGSIIKVTLEYKFKDKLVRVSGQRWIRNTKTNKELTHEWVFAGSVLIPDPDKKSPPFYGANSGDVICVANMETALLDLPVDSSRDNADLSFEAFTERIPALDTPVLIILEPVLEKNKK